MKLTGTAGSCPLRTSLARKEGIVKTILNLFKLRIGVVITFTALAAAAITPGAALSAWKMLVLALSVMIASASAGAFNQFVERDIDARMGRTRGRPFVTGALVHDARWLWLIMALTTAAVLAAGWALNPLSALYVFLGAFFYAVVYTVWLKRRTWMNIVVGGLSGSFAVLAGAAAVAPGLPPQPLILALVLFLWTPPHFWSLAIAYRDDYVAAGVPMLPAVIGAECSARVVLANAVLLVAASLLPLLYGAGPLYFAGAAGGGLLFVFKAARLAREPSRKNAMGSFFASLVQLSLLLVAWMIEAALR
ncbi:MAG TPA: heme o synthase [Burkholderiales bacterium]|nr:heme o synthase [Burkholderiales bacterium]